MEPKCQSTGIGLIGGDLQRQCSSVACCLCIASPLNCDGPEIGNGCVVVKFVLLVLKNSL
jgi:hypothetical protein